jgi:hypothetical protein
VNIMTEITWLVDQMWVRPHEGNLDDVVITVAWRCNGVETVDDKVYTATVYGTVSVTSPDPENFTSYDNLTQQQVLGWCWDSGVDKTATETSIQAQLAEQVNPPVITPPLPW